MMLEMILACYFTFPPFCVVKTVFNKVRVLRLLELIVYQILQSIQSIQLLCPGANQPITNISHPSLCFLFIFCLSLNSFSNKRKCQKKSVLPHHSITQHPTRQGTDFFPNLHTDVFLNYFTLC